MKIHGSCQCGAVRYEAEVEPGRIGLCHCSDCQAYAGAPYRATTPAPAASFWLTAGEPRLHVKLADSGTRRAQAFCAECGSHLYAFTPEAPEIYSLRIGAIAERHAMGTPVRQGWTDSALPWAFDLTAISKVGGQN